MGGDPSRCNSRLSLRELIRKLAKGASEGLSGAPQAGGKRLVGPVSDSTGPGEIQQEAGRLVLLTRQETQTAGQHGPVRILA